MFHFGADNKFIRTDLTVYFLVFVAVFITFWNVFDHSFIRYDDYKIIVNRADSYQGLTPDSITKLFKTEFPREEPLLFRDFTYLINAEIFGPLNPIGYLLGNVLLHTLCSVLVYRLCLVISPGSQLPGLVAALLFAVHPIHVESVAWISSRKDTLYSALFIMSLLSYIKYCQSNKIYFLLLSFSFFVFSLFSKTAAVSFFGIVVAFRICFKDKIVKITRAEIIYAIAIILTTILYVRWYSENLMEYGVIKEGYLLNRDIASWALNVACYIFFYIKKLVIPFNYSISYEYPNAINIWKYPLFVYLAITYCTLHLSSALIFLLKGKREIAFLLLFFLISLIPYLNLAQVNIYVVDRYAYLASVPFCIGVSIIFFNLKKLRVNYITISILITSLCLLYFTQSRKAIEPWQSTLTLWQNANRIAPNMPDTYSGQMIDLMNYYISHKGSLEAETALDLAKQIGENGINKLCKGVDNCPPQTSRILFYLGRIYLLQNDIKNGEKYIEGALALSPLFHDARLFYIRYLLLHDQKKVAAGHIRHLRAAIQSIAYEDILSELDQLSGQIKGNN